eukprot:CAMPEP_0202690832 /NCGR_PEP_ID=MMETSP1385-20130828/5721_1 /ASSEMBLY_ACC=CAM_ASM_000861 /TAXON_ID=933848 /ORGANISM="Elphidium margaritaceum" /LENGTH=914 /DNA_ID=CAMNT_0049346147 /DNA_START=24 /DNA_END=2768 /DNA_ORIENTATION=+
MVDPIGTCQALDLLTQDQLEQLFDESNGYLSKVDEIFDTAQTKESQALVDANNDHDDNEHASDTDEDNNTNNEDDDDGGGSGGTKPKHKNRVKNKKKHKRNSSVIADKKCLILDVDNTLIYVRHFMDEMRVGDTVRLGARHATVATITYRLDLEFSDNPGQMSSYDHALTSERDPIPQRGEWFPDDTNKLAIIHQADPTGCVLHLLHTDTQDTDANGDATNHNHNHADNDVDAAADKKASTEIKISFLQNSDELSMLEPMMERENYLAVSFMYGGYLVRIRPGLAQFLALCNAKYDVILFTAADGSVYQGLLKQVHHILKSELNETTTTEKKEMEYATPHKLWQEIYFRSDCDEKFDEYGLPYRHKNLAKLGRELSTIVMVDDNPLSYRGFEPNSVRVAGFWGLAQPPDNELMQTLFPTLWTIADHKDVRYHLSGLGQPPLEAADAAGVDDADDSKLDAIKEKMQKTSKNADDEDDDETAKDKDDNADEDYDDDELTLQRQHSREASQKFLHHLREAIAAENESLEASDNMDDDEDEDDSHEDDARESEEEDVMVLSTNGGGLAVQQQTLQDFPSADPSEVAESSTPPPIVDTPDPSAAAPASETSHNDAAVDADADGDSISLDIVDNVDAKAKKNETNERSADNKARGEFERKLSPQELDDIFSGGDNNNNNNSNNAHTSTNDAQKTHVQRSSSTQLSVQRSESGVGDQGALIFDAFDVDLDGAMDPFDDDLGAVGSVQHNMLNKRPSVELSESDEVAAAKDAAAPLTNTNARGTAPTTPESDYRTPADNELEIELEQEHADGADFVLTPRQPSTSNTPSQSSNMGGGADVQLLHTTDEYKDHNGSTTSHGHGRDMNTKNTGSRPSRTPTPTSMDADVHIVKSSSSGGCSSCLCFGWFTKKNKRPALAQQELR